MEKRMAKMRTTFVIFRKLPKENNHPFGENSPNLVTLLPNKAFSQKTFFFILSKKEAIGQKITDNTN
jgi:hypothetical protein